MLILNTVKKYPVRVSESFTMNLVTDTVEVCCEDEMKSMKKLSKLYQIWSDTTTIPFNNNYRFYPDPNDENIF